MKARFTAMPQPSINVAQVSTRTVLTPTDSLTHQNCKELEAVFAECMNQQRAEIILDFKSLSFLDSEALELLVTMHKELIKRNGKLIIVGLNSICRDILVVTRLINVFFVYKNIQDALKN